MNNRQQMTIQCPQCGQRYAAPVESLIDAAEAPDAKIRLLSGQLNVAPCPNCGSPNTISVPLVYHDPAKELLITYIPPELALPKTEQERVVGDLIRRVTSKIPQEAFKAYLLQPRGALTLQGLIDQVLAADGITPEILEAQREKMRLVETFLQASEEQLPQLVELHDDKIDTQFFQILALLAQRMLQQGRPDMAQQALEVQQRIVELSSTGQALLNQSMMQEQIVQQVAHDVRAFGQNAQRSDIVDLAIRYADSDAHLQALVGLIRPAFDHTTLQEITVRIGQATAAQRPALEAMRDRIVELTAMIDEQAQAALQQTVQILQAIINSPNPAEMIRQNIDLIDDTFMAVLTANIQEAERRGDSAGSAQLTEIYEVVVMALRENMQPELRFINDLLSAPSNTAVQTMITEHAHDFGPGLLAVVDAVENVVAAQGDQHIMERLAFVRSEMERLFG
jgi:Zn finger protein HypA/HybF involved in hydrogenase expression